MKLSTRVASLVAAAGLAACAAACTTSSAATPAPTQGSAVPATSTPTAASSPFTASTDPSSVSSSSAAPSSAATSSSASSAPSSSSVGPSSTPVGQATSQPGVPTSKVLTIVVENHTLAQMQQGMPYLNSLALQYGYATDYHAIRHPSLPNYLAIAFGTTAGVKDDHGPDVHHVDGESVFSQANTYSPAGARVYAESMTTNCQLTNAYPYAVRHNPWTYGSAGCSTGSVPAGTPSSGRLSSDVADGTLPCAGMLIPDLVHDAHDASLAKADGYLESWLPTLMGGSDFRSGKLAIVVTADEDDKSSDNRVLTVVLSRSVSHKVVTTPLTHYSLSRLYSSVCGDRHYLGEAATAPSLRTAFGLVGP